MGCSNLGYVAPFYWVLTRATWHHLVGKPDVNRDHMLLDIQHLVNMGYTAWMIDILNMGCLITLGLGTSCQYKLPYPKVTDEIIITWVVANKRSP